jgi:hypothetical protein
LVLRARLLARGEHGCAGHREAGDAEEPTAIESTEHRLGVVERTTQIVHGG